MNCLNNTNWEEVVNFTALQTGGVDIDELLAIL